MKNYTAVSSNNPSQADKLFNLNNRASKEKKCWLDAKFDELLNEKCSWSYRSQKLTRNKDMENTCENSLNDISPSINSKNCLCDDPAKTDEGNKNRLLPGILQGGNYLRVKTYSRENRILKSKVKTLNLKLRTSHSNKRKTTKISVNESTVSSASSSDEEVLQTRFPVENKNTFEADENHRYGKNSVLSVTTSDNGSIKENDLNAKTSPIKIHATAHNGRNISNNSNDIKKMTRTKQQEDMNNKNETNMKISSTDSIRVEANYSSTDNESNSIKISNENRTHCHDSKDYLDKKSNHDIPLKKLTKNITGLTKNDSTGTKLKKPKAASNNLDGDIFNDSFSISANQTEESPSVKNFKESILQQDSSGTELEKSLASDDLSDDFLNGSFDIYVRQSDEKPSVKNLKKPLLSNLAQFRNKYISTMHANNKNVRERNRSDKRVINELVKTNKKTKQNYSYNSKRGLFENSPEILTNGMNKKKSDIRQTKNIRRQQTEVTKGRKQSIQKKSKQHGEFKSKGPSRTNKQGNKAKDILFDREEHDLTNNKQIDSSNKTSLIKRNTSRKKLKDYSIPADTRNSSSLTRYCTRKVRNSSLVASRKIKEIEKLENVSDPYGEMIDVDQDVHYTSTPYSFKEFTNYFQTGKACTDRTKEKHKNNKLNTDKNELKVEHAVEENFDLEDTSQHHSRQAEMKNTGPTTYDLSHSENLLSNSFNAFYQKSGSPPLIDKHFMQEKNRDLRENLQNSFTKGRRINKAKDSKSAVDSFYIANMNTPTNNVNFHSFNKTVKRKPRTWEILERDLLEEFDEMPLTGNVSKTFILKEEEVVREKKVVNDTNLFTVSNTSTMQTISTCKTGNQYNMEYEIKNKESKFLESKTETSYNLQKRLDIPHSNEILPNNCQNNSILDRAIAAMEKCTRNFILPEAKICDHEQQVSGFQFEDISDNSDEHHETQFHSSVTFMANDNKQCYSNKIVHYLKKSGRRCEKNINFEEKSNAAQDPSNFRNSEHSEQSVSGRSYYWLENHLQTNSCNEKNQEVVPFSEDKYIDLWGKLMNTLDLETDYEKDKNASPISYPMDISVTEENLRQQHRKSQTLTNASKSSSNYSKRNDKMLVPLHFKAKEIKFDDKTQSKQGVQQVIPKEIALSFTSHTTESENINFEERLMSCETQLKSNNEHETVEKDDAKEKKRLNKLLKEMESKTKITEKQTQRKSEEKSVKQYPKYKFNIDSDGALKIKTSSNSSASNSSKDFTESKNITLNDSKNNKHPNYKTNRTREKYRRYLQRVLSNTKDKTDNKTEPEELQSKEITEKNPNQGKNYQRITRMKLIAENEDDIFSLSSSDSETDKKKTPGSGLLCNLFDE